MAHDMKDRTLSYISIAISLSSLAYAAWIHLQGSEVLARRALRQREAELVRSVAPKFVSIYRDMLPNEPVASKPPATLEELIAPLVKLMEGIGDVPGSSTNKSTR